MFRIPFFFVLAALCWAQAPKVPTIDEALSFKAAGGPRISPDGRWVAYQVREADWEENEYKTQIWLADVASGERFQLTRGKKSSTGPAWSPDGKWIAFGSSREGTKQQVWLISPRGGEAWQLTKDEGGVQAFVWSRNGKRIAYTSPGPEDKSVKDRKEKYGDLEVVAGDYTYSHLWFVDVPAEPGAPVKPTEITSGKEFTVGSFSWSPDSTRIAFSGSRTPDLSDDTSDIYVVDLASKAVKKIVDTKGPDSGPVWSPDGKWIAYGTANASPSHYYTNRRIAVVATQGGTPRILSDGFDEHASPMAWGPEGIYFGAFQKTESAAFVLNPETKAIRKLHGETGLNIGGLTFSTDFTQAAGSAWAANGFSEVYVFGPGPPRRITDITAQFKDYQLANREVVRWKSSDGTVIEGVLMKPANFETGKRYPLLVVIHGGPTGIDMPVRSPDSYYPVEIFAAKGALILHPNYRGSAGYGEAFRSLNVRNLGVGDAWDVLSGVDHLIAQGMADPARVGAMGWSQGGYISAFLTTSTTRFKAISVGAGISDWMTYYVNTDIHPFTRQYLKATPWDDPEIYKKTSPISYIKQAKTPTLIQHGENDRRVPIPNAYQLYQGLRDQGVEARFVVYKGFGHGINKPKQMRHVTQDNLDWFSKWIWGEEPKPEPPKPQAPKP